ncbi:MAG: family 16 glycosylhydrolase [Bacteroidota bacterium]
MYRSIFTSAYLLLLLLFTFNLSAQCPTLVWEDNFDGTTLDNTKWTPQIGDGCDIGICGWGNNELQWYQAQNATVENGLLKITARRENVGGKNYTSSRLRTINKGDWKYGRFEASIKLPTGQGIWPAFWMLPTDNVYGGWPQSGEIDIMELIGREPSTVHGTIHFGQAWPNNSASGEEYMLHEGTFDDDFHEFAIEWEANEIRWYIDDYLYATKNRSDVSPQRWPFDQNFHFLLNVAVGGNWPGNPDGSTVFPQVMEVDYVRVYDMATPTLKGERAVANRAEGVRYTLDNVPDGATVLWTLPSDASFVTNNDGTQVTVDWGDTSGKLTAVVETACETTTIVLDVRVAPVKAKAFTFENFDDEARITKIFSSGQLIEVDNPAGNSINMSPKVGRYERDGSAQFDILVYEIEDLGNVSGYLSGDEDFVLDVYTDAPVGTQILLQLENSNLAQGDNYPRGRHSRFEAVTTTQNEWERLTFKLLDRPDGNISNTAVNQFVFLFASNTFTNNTFHFDNFDSYSSNVVSTKELQNAAAVLTISPNPTNGRLTIQNKSTLELVQFRLLDVSGRVVDSLKQRLMEGTSLDWDLSRLPSNSYILQVMDENNRWYNQFIITR